MVAKKYIQLLQFQNLTHRNETIVRSYTLNSSVEHSLQKWSLKAAHNACKLA